MWRRLPQDPFPRQRREAVCQTFLILNSEQRDASVKNIKWRKLYFEIQSGLFGGESNIEISTWSIIFPGAVSSQLWMIEYSRTNIKFKSLDLMDLVINLSDGIFSAFQTSWRKILGSFLQNYVFFRLLLLSTRLTSFAENHDSLQWRPLCTLMKPLLLDYAKFTVKIYIFFMDIFTICARIMLPSSFSWSVRWSHITLTSHIPKKVPRALTPPAQPLSHWDRKYVCSSSLLSYCFYLLLKTIKFC